MRVCQPGVSCLGYVEQLPYSPQRLTYCSREEPGKSDGLQSAKVDIEYEWWLVDHHERYEGKKKTAYTHRQLRCRTPSYPPVKNITLHNTSGAIKWVVPLNDVEVNSVLVSIYDILRPPLSIAAPLSNLSSFEGFFTLDSALFINGRCASLCNSN